MRAVLEVPHVRRVLGLTWVGWINRLLLRWFFVRLAHGTDARGRLVLTLLRWVWPFPWDELRFVGRSR